MAAVADRVETWDVVIVGAGLAGLYTALMLAETGGRILLLAKTEIAESNTDQAQGGIAASISEQDSPRLHMEDTLVAGVGLCDRDAVQKLVEEGPRGINKLIQLGVKFDRDATGLSLTREGAHSQRRVLHAGDATGRVIREALAVRLGDWANVEFRGNSFALSLLVDGGGNCRGVACIDQQGPVQYLASHVVLASGGACQMYKNTTNPAVATGDGIAMAYRAGIPVRDMEFIQFHPTALLLEGAPRFLISEAVRGEGALLRNCHGRRFMPQRHRLAELAPRDVVARAIVEEMAQTNSSHVWLDVSPLGDRVASRFPTIFRRCKEYNINLPGDMIPVAPAAHYFIGGIVTDQYGRTNMQNLFACGEATCTGIHGANRLASNSLLEALVIGERIAGVISQGGAGVYSGRVDWQWSFLPPRSWADIRSKLREVMWDNVGLQRDHAGLEQALVQLDQLGAELPQGMYIERDIMETVNLLLLSRLVAHGALLRKESRGGHYRLDYPRCAAAQFGHWVFTRGTPPQFQPIRKGGKND